MEAGQNDRGMPGTEREERRTSTASPDGSPIITRKSCGAGLKEDWVSLGTDDPAFWLKEPDQD